MIKHVSRKNIYVGRRFGRLTVISDRMENHGSLRRRSCLCRCDCGNTKKISVESLQSGRTKSCGCYNKECLKNRKTHGMAPKHNRPKIYYVWWSMLNRCKNPKTRRYHRYGGRGISVCDEWKTFEGFWKWAKLGYREGLTIDRINNDGNYEPGNCRWTSRFVQGNNTSHNTMICYHGVTKSATAWARPLGMKGETLSRRLLRGWDIEDAFSLPNGARLPKNYVRNPESAKFVCQGVTWKTYKHVIPAQPQQTPNNNINNIYISGISGVVGSREEGEPNSLTPPVSPLSPNSTLLTSSPSSPSSPLSTPTDRN